MKVHSMLAVIAVMSIIASCKKDQYGNNKYNNQERKVHYELYTNENFSGEKKNVQFRVFMRNNRRSILDSPLATMRVEEIPDFNHRIIIEKLVPGNDTSTLVVGFTYYLENVGYSWYLEEFKAGDTLKNLIWAFR